MSAKPFGKDQRSVLKKWGIKPRMVNWIYTVWCASLEKTTIKEEVNWVQSAACMPTIPSIPSTPAKALLTELILPSPNLYGKLQVRDNAVRLNALNKRNDARLCKSKIVNIAFSN